MEIVKRFARNEVGNDYGVGDIHGYFDRLERRLEEIGFNPEVDRLFPVGDMVDRGPHSWKVAEWMLKPWFHPVRGNHEHALIAHAENPPKEWKYGSEWFGELPEKHRRIFATAFRTLPVAIEVETSQGTVGIVHAECVNFSWKSMVRNLENTEGKQFKQQLSSCLYARDRWEFKGKDPVQDIRAVIVGHQPVDVPIVLGNVHYIDTTGGRGWQELTLINLETLETL